VVWNRILVCHVHHLRITIKTFGNRQYFFIFLCCTYIIFSPAASNGPKTMCIQLYIFNWSRQLLIGFFFIISFALSMTISLFLHDMSMGFHCKYFLIACHSVVFFLSRKRMIRFRDTFIKMSWKEKRFTLWKRLIDDELTSWSHR